MGMSAGDSSSAAVRMLLSPSLPPLLAVRSDPRPPRRPPMVVVRRCMLESRSSVSDRKARLRSDSPARRVSVVRAAWLRERRAREASCAASFRLRRATDAAAARVASVVRLWPASRASSRSRLREVLTAASPDAVLFATRTRISMSLPTAVHLLRCSEPFDFDQGEQLRVLLQQGAGETVEALAEVEDQAGTAVGGWRLDSASIGMDSTWDGPPEGELLAKGLSLSTFPPRRSTQSVASASARSLSIWKKFSRLHGRGCRPRLRGSRR